MPEGDSLHRIARRLQVLVGERVEAESPNPRGLATGVARAVDGRVLDRVEAIGKNLVLRFEGDVIVRSHLRMTGRWRLRRRGGPPPRGAPWLVLRTREWEASQWNGPVLALGAGSRSRARARSARARDRTGRDRRRTFGAPISRAGSERRSLTRDSSPGSGTCGSPRCSGTRACRHGRDSRASRTNGSSAALDWGRHAMAESVEGGRRPRTVYRRAGRGCRRCGDVIRSGGLGDANRTAYWCPSCQPDGDSAEREGFEPSTSGLPPVTP